LFRLLNTRQFTSQRTRWEKFVFEVNAATKRPLQDNKLGTSSEQAGRGVHMVHQIKAPGAILRPGAAREFQFREYADLTTASRSPHEQIAAWQRTESRGPPVQPCARRAGLRGRLAGAHKNLNPLFLNGIDSSACALKWLS
jgi:hypothetical protein